MSICYREINFLLLIVTQDRLMFVNKMLPKKVVNWARQQICDLLEISPYNLTSNSAPVNNHQSIVEF